jgi:hypothetical protein
MLRGAHIYLAGSGKPAIVAALHHNVAGIAYEQETPTVVADWRDGAALAAALRSALGGFSVKDRDLRGLKKTEWPAYRASTCASVREFERTYLCIFVGPVNEAEHAYDAHAQPHGEDDITLHVTLTRHSSDVEMGRKILKLFDACTGWHSSARAVI